ncbi:hypothetical protein [Paenibacillus odorifer]|uniref:Uncharacterized protein n=1 Tax=Paenibacillus odorifer TaxID=189426 RepID=A0ABX3GHR3_9BACL|nr:hypothetical protein [Paenibacillus odorifer]OMD21268.1 hypothetical protein BSO21_23805 [Paenibacillus odorifer]
MVNELNLLKLIVTLKADSSPARPHGFSRTSIMWLLIRKNGLRALRNIIIHFRTDRIAAIRTFSLVFQMLRTA